MRKNGIVYGIIGLVAGLLIGALGLSNIVSNSNSTSNNNTVKNTSRSDTMDQHFIEQMIPHHEDAITMAELAQNNAKRTEVKNLAKAIISAQSTEIDDMKNWYNNWYGKEVPEGEEVMSGHGMMAEESTHMGMMGDKTDMARLEKAADFDKAFIEEMIPHHQMAVMMAQMLKNGSQRDEMKQLADNIIKSQTEEIDQMRDWYSQWYQK